MAEPVKILYIEDNLDNQRLVQRVLSARGYTVLVAEDGPGGLALAREAQPDLVLIDLAIPGLNGFETTTRLRSLPALAAIPIVAITANSMPGSRERALVAGCDGYIVKPIDPRQFPAQIAEFMAGKRELVSPAAEAGLLRAYNRDLVEKLERQVRELMAANAELQELDRLKSQFLSTLSHELRTPLTSLMGYLELFDKGTLGKLSEPQRDALGVMRRNTETLAQQLNNLLYFQELRSHQFTRAAVRLHERLRDTIVDMQHRAFQAGVHMEALVASTEPLYADGRAIETVVRNLLDNAIKFTARGGRVRLLLHDEESRVLLRVEDTGCGIPAEAIEKIFLPFYQVDSSLARPYPGSGLGLAIVRHIVDAHGGQVTVRSVEGRGSVFTVVLPREPASAQMRAVGGGD